MNEVKDSLQVESSLKRGKRKLPAYNPDLSELAAVISLEQLTMMMACNPTGSLDNKKGVSTGEPISLFEIYIYIAV